jgi:predicted nucleic acid-binding protein
VRVLLDTTVLIDYLRNRPVAERVETLAKSMDQPCTTAINVEEVVRGLLPGEFDRAHFLFDGLEILPLGKEEAWRSGSWRQSFAKQGMTLSQADCLLAAAAYTSGAKIVTGNVKDFPMPDVEVEHWPVGE